MDLLIANHAVMPPTSLSANIKYSSICSEKNEDLVLAIKMGLGLSWKFNSPEERSIISRYEVRSVRAPSARIFNHIPQRQRVSLYYSLISSNIKILNSHFALEHRYESSGKKVRSVMC